MFTVKACRDGQIMYKETPSISLEDLACGKALRFSAESQEFWFAVADYEELDSDEPINLFKFDRIYIMNDQGKTIEVIR